MNRVYILAFLIALLASFLLTPYVKKLAFKIGALDRPNKRKVHHKVMPRLGGLAIYCGFLLSVLCTMHISRDVLGLLLGGTVIMIVGVIDDKYQLPAKVKLLGQILAACVLVLFDIKIEWLNNPWGGYFYLEYFSIPLTIFWVISFTNVVNLIDGLDGLAAGVSAIASITVILVAVQQGVFPVAILTAALAGGIIGFIRYNFNPASIFIMDTAFAILRRYTNGRPIFQPDKGHLHHRLLAMGMSQRQAVLFMYAISATLSVAAVVLTEVDGYFAAVVIAIIVTCVAIGAKKIGILNDR